MKLCEKCFTILEVDSHFCQECGAPVDDSPASDGSDSVIYPELARANLLRIRGDFSGSERVCLAILKRYPNNTTTHILLGDIYAEQDRLEQAKQWYEMALDLEPNNPLLKTKSERITKELERRHQQINENALVVKPPSPQRLAIILAVVLLVAVFGALTFWLGSTKANALRDKRADVIEPISINATPPVIPSQPTPTPEEPRTNNDTFLMDSERQVAESASKALSNLGGQVSAVTIDPRTAHCIITIQCKSDVNPYIASALVAENALSTNSGSLQSVDVRCFMSGNLSLVATATPESIRQANGFPHASLEWAQALLQQTYRP